jgi:hypothetical protein
LPNVPADLTQTQAPRFANDLKSVHSYGATALSPPESIATIAFSQSSALQQLATDAATQSTATTNELRPEWTEAKVTIEPSPTAVEFSAIADLEEAKAKQLDAATIPTSTDQNASDQSLEGNFTPPIQVLAQQPASSDSVPNSVPNTDPGRDIYRIQDQPQLPRLVNPDIPAQPPNTPIRPGDEQNSEDGQEQAQPPPCDNFDPELGCIDIKIGQPPPPPRSPIAYLIPRFDVFNSTNVYSQLVQVRDALIRPGITLLLIPPLGKDTYFIGSVDGNLVRYFNLSDIDYNELRLRAGIYQRLSPSMFAEVGWSNQQLFIARDEIDGLPKGSRFFKDNSVRLELSRRDQLGKRFSLNSFYQFRYSFTEPVDQSRIANTLVLSLNYDLIPNRLQAGIDYQLSISNFTHQNRDDFYNQLLARLTYTMFRNTQLSAFAGYTFGHSTDPLVDLNSFIAGVGITVNLPLF